MHSMRHILDLFLIQFIEWVPRERYLEIINREVQYIQTYKDNFGHMHVRILYSVTQANW